MSLEISNKNWNKLWQIFKHKVEFIIGYTYKVKFQTNQIICERLLHLLVSWFVFYFFIMVIVG